MKSPVERAFVKPLASIFKLKIYSIASSLFSTNFLIWWSIISICLVQFWLLGSLVKVELVLLSPSIFISLTALSGRSLFRSQYIYILFLTFWLIVIYLAFKVDANTVCCYLLHQVIIAPPKKKKYLMINFLSSRSLA